MIYVVASVIRVNNSNNNNTKKCMLLVLQVGSVGHTHHMIFICQIVTTNNKIGYSGNFRES